MGVIGPKTLNGFEYPTAYVRMGTCPQAQKEDGMARICLDLHASKAAYLAIKGTQDKGLKPRWLMIDIYATERTGRPPASTNQFDGTKRIVMITPDVVRLWGATPVNPTIPSNQWPRNSFAQGWAMISSIEELAGMVSDEA